MSARGPRVRERPRLLWWGSGAPSAAAAIRRRSSVATLVIVLGTLAGLVLGASPAGADPAEPTNYRSKVLAETPDAPGVEVRIEGGDAFVTIEVEAGHTVIVEGYDSEEWLRIEPDGTVSQNLRSRATYWNADRLALTPVPADIRPTDAPEYEVVGEDGRYTWHDHRTHWMSPDLPPVVVGRESETVVVPLVAGSSEWTIPVVVDGTPTVVTGQLVWNPDVASTWRITTIALGLAVAGVSWVLGAASLRWSAPAVGLAGAGMLVVGMGEWRGQPAAFRGAATELITPTVVVVLAAAGVRLISRRRDQRNRRDLGAMATLGATMIGILWAFGRTDTITLPVLPSTLSSATLRVLYMAIVALIASGAGSVRMVLVTAGRPAEGRAAPRRRIGPSRHR